jgi:thiamine-monophosphate kinase
VHTISDLGERALIQRITARLATPPWVIVGPGDDAAVMAPERGEDDVLTTDAQIEEVHFDRRFVPPDAIGHRALAVNLSDLAAMGAQPRAALLSLALPGALDVGVVDGLMDGMLALAASHQVAIIGGNITRSPGPMMVDVTAIGSVRRRRVLTRGGARPGDDVYVTGTIGDAAVGLRSLQARCAADPGAPVGGPSRPAPHEANACERRFLRPEPRVRAGLLLGRNRAASACMDLSDGLGDGVRQIAEASGVGMVIDASALPIPDEARRWYDGRDEDAVDAALGGGDDYELLFTLRPSWRGRLRGVQRNLSDLPITRIGAVTKDRRLVVRTPGGDRPLPGGYEHYR